MNATIVQKDNEKKTVRLVNEARLKELLWGELPEEERPTRRTLLTWRDEGVLPFVKMGSGPKCKVFYRLDDCLENIEKLTHRKRARKTRKPSRVIVDEKGGQ